MSLRVAPHWSRAEGPQYCAKSFHPKIRIVRGRDQRVSRITKLIFISMLNSGRFLSRDGMAAEKPRLAPEKPGSLTANRRLRAARVRNQRVRLRVRRNHWQEFKNFRDRQRHVN